MSIDWQNGRGLECDEGRIAFEGCSLAVYLLYPVTCSDHDLNLFVVVLYKHLLLFFADIKDLVHN